MTDLIDRSLAEIALAFRDGSAFPEALLEEATARHQRWDSDLGAYKLWDADGARAQAMDAARAFAAGNDHGQLQGIPVSVKDLYGLEGHPTFAGTPRELPAEWRREGDMVAALRAHSAVIPGKTHTVEFAFGGIGINNHWSTPRNPWDAENHRVPGGSSAGAGVSLIEGSALLAYGSDTGGSVRIPAAMTGNTGLKVTIGRWPATGIVPLSFTYDTPGILARTAADLAFAFAALDATICGTAPAAIAPADPGSVRIGLTEDYFWQGCSPGIAEAVATAIGEIAAKGAGTLNMPFPEAAVLGGTAVGSIAAAEVHAFLVRTLPDWLETLDAVVEARIKSGGGVSSDEYLGQRALADEQAVLANARLADVDVLCVPTVAVTPPRVEDLADGESYRRNNILALRNTIPGNLLKLCALTLPIGLDAANMPVGLQLIARGGNEERLLSVALAFERILGTPRDRLGKPPLGG